MEKAKELARKIQRTKPHLDYIAATLTIPVLITAIILNINNLHRNSTSTTPTPTPVKTTPYGNTGIQTVKVTSVAQPTDSPNCAPGIGTMSIDYPQNNQTVADNPLCVDLSYESNNHCSVAWSYRINNGPWSDYSNNSVCLYNMPSGQVNFDLQVKSLTNNDTKTIHTTFQYDPVTPTPTTIPTPTVTPTPTVVTPTPTPVKPS